MKSKFSLFFVLATLLVSVFAPASALWTTSQNTYDDVDIKEMTVYVSGEPVWYGICTRPDASHDTRWYCETYQYSTPSLERGETLPIRVTFESEKDLEEVKVKAWINGYKDDIEDETNLFDVHKDYSYTKYLNLDIPEDIDATEEYTLYVEVMDGVAFQGVARAQIDLQVQQVSHILEIKSVELYAGQDICGCYVEQVMYGSCGGCSVAFEAGSKVYADVVVKNMGSQEQEDVYVKISIEELCIERTVYVGDLSSGKAKEVTLYFVLPGDALGNYELEVEAFSDDTETTVKQTFTVVKGTTQGTGVDIFFERTRKNVEQGETVTYIMNVENHDFTEDFMVSVEGTSGWAVAQVSPAVFTLDENESRTVSIQLTVDEDAIVAEHQFTVKVKYGNQMKTFNLSADVKERGAMSSTLDLKYFLLIVGIILAVIVIILLILLIAKNGKSKVETPEEYSYY